MQKKKLWWHEISILCRTKTWITRGEEKQRSFSHLWIAVLLLLYISLLSSSFCILSVYLTDVLCCFLCMHMFIHICCRQNQDSGKFSTCLYKKYRLKDNTYKNNTNMLQGMWFIGGNGVCKLKDRYQRPLSIHVLILTKFFKLADTRIFKAEVILITITINPWIIFD
jgi:hypothetical protein